MKVLAADTATKVISVALLEGEQINPVSHVHRDGVKAEMHQPYSKSQGSALIPVIKRLFEEAGYHIKEIELFCVGLGPGSFTGLRTSVATMRSLSIALGKPIIGISSFDVIAYNVIRDTRYEIRDTDICVLFDARQNKAYARFYRDKKRRFQLQRGKCPHYNEGLRKGTLSPLKPETSLYPAEPITDFILDNLENILAMIKQPTIIAGDMITSSKVKILNEKEKLVSFAPEKLWYPRADILAKMAQDKYEKGQRDDPFKLLPLYIYPKECQVKKSNIKNQISK